MVNGGDAGQASGLAPVPDWIDHVADAVEAALGTRAAHDLHGDRLRSWGSSEVWRICADGGSIIVKRGTGEMAGEAAILRDLVAPLQVPSPDLLLAREEAGAAFLVLADAVARTAAAPTELPMGAVTALVGVPFFLWLLRRRPT